MVKSLSCSLGLFFPEQLPTSCVSSYFQVLIFPNLQLSPSWNKVLSCGWQTEEAPGPAKETENIAKIQNKVFAGQGKLEKLT